MLIRCRLGSWLHTCVGQTVVFAGLHGPLGLCELSRGNHFHGLEYGTVNVCFFYSVILSMTYLCDFFDVAYGL